MKDSQPTTLSSRRGLRIVQFLLGFSLALVLLIAIGEVGLRIAPPRTIQPYLASEDKRTGPFRDDPRFGVQYKSWEAFASDYAAEMPKYEKLFRDQPPPSWAMFGNSFVQAQGMLADTARKHIPQRVIFNLGRNEELYVRVAQIAMLLDRGLRPQRIFFTLLPIDAVHLANHGIKQVHANEQGAVAFYPRTPPISKSLLDSRLFLAGWVRSEFQHNIPLFNAGELNKRVDPVLRDEFRDLFSAIGEATTKYQIPVTVLFLPNYEQVVKGAGFAYQDELTVIAIKQGFDVLDIRDLFSKYSNKPALFIPDKHFSELGNRMQLRELIRHLHQLGEAGDIPEFEVDSK